MPYTTTRNRTNKHRKRWITAIVILILLIVGGAYWWHRTHHKSMAASLEQVRTNTGHATVNPNVPGGSGNSTTGSSASKTTTSSKAPATSVHPTAPTGQFVSDHYPNLSGSPAPNTETSTCTTTPGADCQIRFTSGSIVKALPAQPTDSSGNTIWSNWTLQSVGLAAGTWQITAVASNGPNAATAKDSMRLVVAK